MSRRTATFISSLGLLIALIGVAFFLPVPYIAFSPGPTENTIGAVNGQDLITISGRETYPTEGHLDLTTVSVTTAESHLDLGTALKAWRDPTIAVLPRSFYYQDGVDPDVVQQQNAEEMTNSQQDAIAAALGELDIPVGTAVYVQSIAVGSPALNHLKAGDKILAIDGTEISAADQVVAAITAHAPGDDIVFTVNRASEQMDVTVTAVESTDSGPKRTVVGFVPGIGYDFPFDVTIALGQDIGGPSAGTMFALGIIDKLTPGALTGGAYIAGTGTIDPDGSVGPIGGIQQKLVAARDNGATIFMVPAGDCADAAKLGLDGIRLVKMSTLHEAYTDLQSLASGSSTGVASCS